MPPPQVTEQYDQSVHSPHFLAAVKMLKHSSIEYQSLILKRIVSNYYETY